MNALKSILCNRSTAADTGAVCCIFRLLGPRDGRHPSPGGLIAPLSLLSLSLSLGKLAISLHNVLQWGWVESAMAQDRHRAGNVMKHTLETDHMDM